VLVCNFEFIQDCNGGWISITRIKYLHI